MDERELFFNNVIDSILSFKLDKSVYFKEDIKITCGDLRYKTGKKFTNTLVGTDYVFYTIELFRTDKNIFDNIFNIREKYSLDIVTKEKRHTYSITKTLSTDNFIGDYIKNRIYYNKLKQVFDFLLSRIDESEKLKTEEKYKNLNLKISINIDKSIKRNNTLNNILKK